MMPPSARAQTAEALSSKPDGSVCELSSKKERRRHDAMDARSDGS